MWGGARGGGRDQSPSPPTWGPLAVAGAGVLLSRQARCSPSAGSGGSPLRKICKCRIKMLFLRVRSHTHTHDNGYTHIHNYIMKEFDESAAKKGAGVCTREGYPVTILSFDNGSLKFPITGEFTDDLRELQTIDYSSNGRLFMDKEDDLDLMMADDDYREKLARGEYDASESRVLAPYLPYGLYVYRTIYGRYALIGGNTEWRIDPSFFKYNVPILRPMSQLSKEIVESGYNDGKPFVPIAKLVEAATGLQGARVQGELGSLQIETENWVYRYSLRWHPKLRTFSFAGSAENKHLPLHERLRRGAWNQYQVYDLLHQWHFDYRGLIEQGKAISVEECKINPYSAM